MRVSAVWGPALLDQLQGGEVLGVATLGGVLRVLHVSHSRSPTPDLLEDVRRVLLGDRLSAGAPSGV